MPGIIFLLDEANHARVEGLWDQMEREFGVAKGFPGALPHLTVHLAGAYEMEATRMVVDAFSKRQAPFEAETSGLGVFTGELPIVYIPVIRTHELDAAHAALYRAMAGHCSEDFPYYAPNRWMPHITIGQVNIRPEVLAPLLGWLSHQPLAWTLRLATLAIGENDDFGVELSGTFPLRG